VVLIRPGIRWFVNMRVNQGCIAEKSIEPFAVAMLSNYLNISIFWQITSAKPKAYL